MPHEWISQFRLKLKALVLRRRFDQDLEDELQFHLAMREAHLEAEGLPPAEARSAARRRFGNATRIKEDSRGLWTFTTIEAFWHDLRYGARMLAKNPGFAAVAIVTLALGIGANTAMFAITDAALLKPLPYPNPSQLVFLRELYEGTGSMSFSMPDFRDLAEQNHSFQDMAVYDFPGFILTGKGQPTLLSSMRVSAPFFALLGEKASLGRLFTSSDDRPAAPPVAVVSYGFWQDRLGGDRSILGHDIVLSGKSYTVIGVLQPDFRFLDFRRLPDAYVPIGLWGATPGMQSRGQHGSLSGIGRLRPGVSVSAARADLDAIMARLAREYPATNHAHLAYVESLAQELHGDNAPFLLLLLAAVGLVLLIACANLASLQLARATTRLREFAIRSAMGAPHGRVFRQLLSESLLLAVAGGAAGLLVAAVSMPLLLRLAPGAMEATINMQVLAFNLVVALAAGVLFGFAPALQLSKLGPASALQQTARAATAHSGERLRRRFLVAEIALALVLATAAGLMLRSLAAAENTNPGFDPNNLLALSVVMTGSRYASPKGVRAAPSEITFLHSALEHLRALPGVVSAGAATCPPLAGECWDYFYSIVGKPAPTGMAADAEFSEVDPGYFSTIRAPILAGRDFTEADNASSEPVTIINEAMAKMWWPHSSPLGSQLRVGEPNGKGETFRIVGVVADVRQDGLDVPQMPEAFFPLAQSTEGEAVFVIRALGNPEALTTAATAAIHDADPDMPVRVHRLTDLAAASLAHRQFVTLLLTLFGVLALGLASLGVYGLISFAVAQRTQEIGVRMALGAVTGDILRLVIGTAARLALAGVAIGFVAALALSRVLRSFLYGVGAFDPVTFAAAILLLLIVALAACYLPARRATRVDPNVALRCE
jgi:putative ABC transport system permease protein